METENNPKVPIYKITYEVAQDGSFAFIVNGDVAPKKDPRDESEFLGAKPLEIFFDNNSVKAFMSAATLAPKEASTQSHSEVTADDLANLERVLAKIDLRNFVLGCVSQWLIAWELAREICEDFEASPRTVQENLAQLFRNVIDRTASQGDTILGLALNKSLGIDLDHFKLHTRCTPNDVKACVTVLRDRITQFFAPHDPAFGETILKSIEHESSTIGSSSI